MTKKKPDRISLNISNNKRIQQPLARSKNKYDNPWDDEISPKLNLQASSIRHTNHCLSNLPYHLEKLSCDATAPIKNLLYRSQQLAYLQPVFQALLDPSLQNNVYIATIGQKYWVIGAKNGALALRFKFQSKTIHYALSQYLEKDIPPFKLRIFPKTQLMPTEKTRITKFKLSKKSAEALQENASSIQHEALKKALLQLTRHHK